MCAVFLLRTEVLPATHFWMEQLYRRPHLLVVFLGLAQVKPKVKDLMLEVSLQEVQIMLCFLTER